MNKLNRALLIVALCTVSACVVLALYIMVPPAHASSQAPGESGFPTAQTTETPVTAPSSSPAVPRLLSVYQG
ncbi:MAG: hypothetical protein FWF49_05430, partial [Oscillospiraceae bacterium]|nr:hypothetical protein [Oscillospiraceae bacterium]